MAWILSAARAMLALCLPPVGGVSVSDSTGGSSPPCRAQRDSDKPNSCKTCELPCLRHLCKWCFRAALADSRVRVPSRTQPDEWDLKPNSCHVCQEACKTDICNGCFWAASDDAAYWHRGWWALPESQEERPTVVAREWHRGRWA